ncbi:Rha family transcriptional regulator [Paraburkholderia kururiensis]|uniref:Phage antirepressor KilAC domain-containing protein n=1 Tax=Paraburkholderia kururiensis TaxID=984307 RepID=A0ABZ0WSE1_9BURK|nr:phage antirepressor KilAC domain-containing protein [Paraburkholderia kururiensis]WQD80155.1 phage antirepressor KilAC domain-containing protein [Paraburkholderia kururiensis]
MAKKEKAETREGSAKIKSQIQCADTSVPRQSAALVRVRGADLITDSLTIAQEFGRRHDNVMRSLSILITNGTLGPLDSKETSYIDHWNRSQPCIELTERGALIAMPFIGGARSRQGQVRLVDAFLRLRDQVALAQPAQSVPQTLAGALRFAAELADRCARLESATQRQTQYAAALDRLAAASGSMNLTAAAKSLKVKPTYLFNWLSREQWIYRRGGGRWAAYQVAIMRGVLEHRTTTIQRGDGADKAVAQVLVTSKGLAELARKLPTSTAQGARQ